MNQRIIDRAINLDLPGAGSPSILVQGEKNPEEFKRAVLTGLRMGFGFAVLLIIIVGIIMTTMDIDVGLRRWFTLLSALAGLFLGAFFTTGFYMMECNLGFVRVDNTAIAWWTPFGLRKIPMELVFGAGEEIRGENKFLRLAWLADNKRGFKTLLRSFRWYDAAYGPVKDEGFDGLSGNELIRKAVILHLEERIRSRQSIAQVPEYRFESTAGHKRMYFQGDASLSGYFRSDGKNLYISQSTEFDKSSATVDVSYQPIPEEMKSSYEVVIPVTNIQEAIEYKSPGGTGGDYLYIGLRLKEPDDEVIRVFYGLFTNGHEMVKYCEVLPVTFPKVIYTGKIDDGYFELETDVDWVEEK